MVRRRWELTVGRRGRRVFGAVALLAEMAHRLPYPFQKGVKRAIVPCT